MEKKTIRDLIIFKLYTCFFFWEGAVIGREIGCWEHYWSVQKRIARIRPHASDIQRCFLTTWDVWENPENAGDTFVRGKLVAGCCMMLLVYFSSCRYISPVADAYMCILSSHTQTVHPRQRIPSTRC